MIEFAPNPSGPAHIGTLRSYAAAWKLARETGESLSLRFDHQPDVDPNYIINGGPSAIWAANILADFTNLLMPPDVVLYFDATITVDRIDEKAYIIRPHPPIPSEVRPFISLPDDRFIPPTRYACLPMPSMRVPDFTPSRWMNNGSIPMMDMPDDLALYALEVRGRWLLSQFVTSLLHCLLRGVRVMVRSKMSAFIGDIQTMFAEHLGMSSIPRVHETAVVVGDYGAFSKSSIGPDDEGTIRWAIREYGIEKVRGDILASLDDDRPIIHFGDIFSDR